ncbi:MAG: membrane-bound lytic murein transglycosylase MltC [Desulfovibrio sp.]|uniref:membrane-bound lytic murein transglycosylase MltC n=1 Tax=Desulfovibrio sp. 7SRBS1 TaxID=3378064 RepID=UPI003B40B71B
MDPEGFARDVKSFEKEFKAILAAFEKAVRGEWGKKEEEKATPKKYVKYTQNYQSRAVVNFDKGEVVVETVDQANPLKSLREAVVTTLLTPGDPQAVDMYSAKPVKLGEEPYLYGEVRDQDGKFIRWQWRAERYADYLVNNRLQKRPISTDKGVRTVYSVRIAMVADHMEVRAARYKTQVAQWAGQFGVSKSLVYAIMQTESDFNPFAVSSAPAFGLMQIVPSTAGQDVRKYLTGKSGVPTRQFLFNANNNIQYGSTYLHMLDTKYLKRISNPTSREYCVISAYNGGAGNVLRTFSSDRDKAVRVINSLSPAEVYRKLRYEHRRDESRRYLEKVTLAKKKYVRI